jgi:acylphosphatase
LSPHKGFRNYVKHRAIAIGVKGFIWRIPNVHASIVISGTYQQVLTAESFLLEMKEQGMIEAIARVKQPEQEPFDGFSVLPSVRKGVKTGDYSDKALDEVASHSSADQPAFLGA